MGGTYVEERGSRMVSTRRSTTHCAVAALVTAHLLSGGIAGAAPGDPRVVTGTIEWPATVSDERFVVIRTADGAHLYLEVVEAPQGNGAPLAAGDRIAVAAVEGERPFELRGAVIVPGDIEGLQLATDRDAVAALSPEELTERLDGRIEAVAGPNLVVRGADGLTTSVDIGRVTGSQQLPPGSEVTIFGVQEENGLLVASGLVGFVRPDSSGYPATSW